MKRYLLLLLPLLATAQTANIATMNSTTANVQTNRVGAAAASGLSIVQYATDTETDDIHSVALTGCAANARLVLTAANENNDEIAGVSGGGLTWTLRSAGKVTDSANANIWTAEFAAGGNITVDIDWPWAGAYSSAVLYELAGHETTAAGSSATNTLQTAPSCDITTTRDDSIVFVVSSDWNSVSGTATYRGSPVERLDDYTSGHYHAWHYYYVTTSSGLLTTGMTAPGSQSASTCAYEIRKP